MLEPKTTIWKRGVDGLTLVKTFPGLPFGDRERIFVENFGEVLRSSVTKHGSGENETVEEVAYTLQVACRVESPN